jgi:6-pyruvoyltetrahydropterin/6-carboxytetrahydropterin synthase
MSDNFRVRIAKAEHVFSAGHFITFGGICERLHGHNYRVACELSAPLDENHLAIDFLLVRAKLLEITTWLDHYMLLPSDHPEIRVEENGRDVTATFRERRWVFPSGDCRILPVANTTSELLAAYIGRRLLESLAAAGNKITHIRVELDECDGQLGIWETDTERSVVI